MAHVSRVTLLAALVLALLAPLSLAGVQPPPPIPARLLMDPPTQAELDAQAALLPAGVAPLIRVPPLGVPCAPRASGRWRYLRHVRWANGAAGAAGTRAAPQPTRSSVAKR